MVTVVVLCACLCVCPDTLFWQYARLKVMKVNVKHQICGNIKMAFFLKLSYFKVRAFFLLTSAGAAILAYIYTYNNIIIIFMTI